MASIQNIKILRKETNAPIMDCKRALLESNDHVEKAKELLKKSGKDTGYTIVPKTGRIVACQIEIDEALLIGIAVVRTETDFVAKSAAMLQAIQYASEAIAYGFVDMNIIEKRLLESTKQFGENITLGKESVRLTTDLRTDIRTAVYIHFNGQRASYIQYKLKSHHDPVDVGKRIAVQCVVTNPKFLTKDTEKEIKHIEKIINVKRPEKNSLGKTNNQFEEHALLKQHMFDEPSITVGALAEKNNIEILSFKTIVV